MEEMDTFIVAASSGSNEAVSPGAECDRFYSSTMNPSMLFKTCQDYLDMTPADCGLNSSYAISTGKAFLFRLRVI
jgi:hypothetical protein